MDLLAQQLRLSAVEAEVAWFQRLARNAPVGILLLGSDGAARFANDEYLRIVGRTREAFDEERFRPGARGAPPWLRSGTEGRLETEHVRDDGTRVPILVGVSAQRDGIAAFVVDLTAEKAAQRAREESEARCRAVAEQLQQADRRKDEFLGVLSHELRNPLAPIRAAVHLLAHAGDPSRAERARRVIERQVTHLARLVDDLLDATRISRGRIELHRAPLDLAAVVRDTVEDHRAGLEVAGLDLEIDLPARPVPVDADATRIAQVLGNLLANAAKFTPRGGRVAVRLGEEDGAAALEVRDTGEGFDPAVLARLFEPFSQADRSLARSRGGLGLGLALVKALVELHGGTVSVASPGPGGGARVLVRLPLAPAPCADAPRPARAPVGGRRRVLVVEDNPDAAETLREALELEGMEVTVAGDGASGLAAARRERPDLVVCDIGLPGGLDGYAVAREVRADPALRDVPLLALTGYAGPEDRTRALEAGFDRHLGKPAGIDELLRAISPLLPQ